MDIVLDPNCVESYRQFLEIKKLPAWSIKGRVASFPDEYAARIGAKAKTTKAKYSPEPFLFDYQQDIARLAIDRQKFAVFADCGLGKSLIYFSYARHVFARIGKRQRVLMITPPLVVPQMIDEAKRFYGDDFPIERVRASGLAEWLSNPGECIGVTNYEALKEDTPQGCLGALILDESSVLKSHYGKQASICLRLGRGLEWKLCGTGTPAPNDRIEYANHAVLLDRFPTVNSFLAKYFVNRGQTDARWELKPHALRPFYRSLSDWCIFLSDPSVYGWKDNVANLPPINVHIHDVELTTQQKDWVQKHLGTLIATRTGGITMRSSYGQVSKGFWKGQRFETNKPGFIADLVNSWRAKESTLLWCKYDDEQSLIHAAVGGESLDGKTPWKTRLRQVEAFKAGEVDALTSKPRILGFGLNLQAATRQVFSTLQDSYEEYYQCIKRSNRIGSTRPLHAHLPVTELELPMVENVLRKADRVESDTKEQESMFRDEWVRR